MEIYANYDYSLKLHIEVEKSKRLAYKVSKEFLKQSSQISVTYKKPFLKQG